MVKVKGAKEERNKRRNEKRTLAVLRNNDWCFQVRVYNRYGVGMHRINKQKAAELYSLVLRLPCLRTCKSSY
jgi:hypothetical protein